MTKTLGYSYWFRGWSCDQSEPMEYHETFGPEKGAHSLGNWVWKEVRCAGTVATLCTQRKRGACL